MSPQKINRRYFFGTTGAALAAAALSRPRKAVAANDKILMGLIGAGGRGRGVMRSFLKVDPAVQFIAMCDVCDERRSAAARDAVGKDGDAGKVKKFNDHRQLLDMKEINAVLIASPTHWHCAHLLDSVAAGKDAYCEKPMSYTIEQGAEMVKTVRRTDRIVQIGMQRRSSPMIQEARKLVGEGILGRLVLVRAEWFWHVQPLNKNAKLPPDYDWDRFLGSAPKRPVEPIRALSWRYFWDYEGGIVTDQGTHLMDVVQWLAGKGTALSAAMQGGSYLLGYETPDTFSAALEYDGFTASWMCTYNNCYQNNWQIFFQGDKGTMIVDDGGFRIYAEPWRDKKNQVPVKEVKGGIPTEPHVENFLECIKTRKQPNAPVEVGHTAVSGPHLCNQAFRHRAVAKLDKECTKVTV